MIDTTKIDQLVKKVTEPFDKFIYFEDPLFHALSTIYVLFTYFYDIFDKIPYLQIYGLKGSGKSFLGSLFNKLCFKPFKTGNISMAAIYRKIGSEHNGLTLIIDEKDDLSHSHNKDLLGILRSGYERSGSVTRCGPKGTTVELSTFCPKIIINEKGIQDSALESRTIPIHMVELKFEEFPDIDFEKFREIKFEEECKEIKDLIQLFVKEYRELVLTRYHSFKSVRGIKGRDEEVWTPILVIAGILQTPDAPNTAFIKDNMVELAKKIIRERKRMEIIGNLDAQILEATLSYIEVDTASGPNDSYLGEKLLDHIKDCWSIPGLRLEAVSRTLQRHKVLTSFERRRVREKGLSTPKMCYKFDKEKLEKLVNKIL